MITTKYLKDITTKNDGRGRIELITTFTDNTFQSVSFQRGAKVDDITYALLIFRLNIIEATKDGNG